MQSRTRRRLAETAAVAAGLAVLALAAAATPAWFQRHFLPEFFSPRPHQLRILLAARLAAAALGALLLWPGRVALGRWAERRTGREMAADVLPTLLAAVAALAVSEAAMRRLPWFANHQLPAQREPLRRRDDLTGWAYAGNRVGRGVLGGRTIEYAFDADGHRVAAPGQAVDYAAPSILFLGESIVVGHGLTYAESIPARVGARLGLQPADLAVGGFATDQMYLRFEAEWPRYRDPRAVVILFMPSLFHRNLEQDRPYLDANLVRHPPRDDVRLIQVAHRLVPYRATADLDAAVLMTRRALGRIVRQAAARGAPVVILVPQLTAETAEERAIGDRVLAGLPALRVKVNPAWHLPHNRHPDARADAVLAAAVADALAARGVSGGSGADPGGGAVQLTRHDGRSGPAPQR